IGRQVALSEVLRITDETKDAQYCVKSIANAKRAPDNHIIVQPGKQLYLFTKKGKYLKNLYKQGEGPGEMKWLESCRSHKGKILMCSLYPLKIIELSAEGNFIKEFRVKDKHNTGRLISVDDKTLYFHYRAINFEKLKRGENHVGNVIFYSNYKGECTYLPESYETGLEVIQKKANGRKTSLLTGMSTFKSIDSGSDVIYFFHEERYRIRAFDKRKKTVVKEFSRPYEPV
ncbi:MAG: 6-bladed beta-propeller, partial [bacterium]|nr:6-bladed beta-propeller [bacterium]